MADKSLAKAFRRKMGPDEGILTKSELKIGEASFLMNPVRRLIFEDICNFPCNHLRAISRKTGYSVQNIKWHLRKLREANLISENSIGNKKVYTPLKNIISPPECKVLALMNKDEIRQVYLAIKKKPKITQKKLSLTLDIYQQKLSLILISLEDANLISQEKTGNKKLYSTTDKIRELKKSFDQRANIYRKTLIEALSADSLNPKIEESSLDTISMKLEIGGGESYVLKINRNPFSAFTGSD